MVILFYTDSVRFEICLVLKKTRYVYFSFEGGISAYGDL